MNPLTQFKEIGQAFVTHYYKVFDENRAALLPLYVNDALMTFEGSQIQGPENIIKKLISLPFQKIQHVITTFDSQPTLDGQGVIVFVVGQLKTDEDAPHSFSQCFYLKPLNGSWFVTNDMFRLSLHHA
ncbi:nuclear transport factor 2-like [Ptychodera flava]|uniref:nuclear transport factor 2-like n=1 Tax=Ptychodera flava TaxID=63121 RepID=UPI00396A1D87